MKPTEPCQGSADLILLRRARYKVRLHRACSHVLRLTRFFVESVDVANNQDRVAGKAVRWYDVLDLIYFSLKCQ